jgi:hypothetical protein
MGAATISVGQLTQQLGELGVTDDIITPRKEFQSMGTI